MTSIDPNNQHRNSDEILNNDVQTDVEKMPYDRPELSILNVSQTSGKTDTSTTEVFGSAAPS